MLAFPARRWAISISWFCKFNIEQERLLKCTGTYVQFEIEDTTDEGRFPDSWLKGRQDQHKVAKDERQPFQQPEFGIYVEIQKDR